MLTAIYTALIIFSILIQNSLSAGIDKNTIERRKQQADFVQFERYLDSLLVEAETKTDTGLIATELFYLGVYWAMNNHYEKGAELLSKTENIFSEIHSYSMILYSCYYKANFLWHLSRYNEAVFELNKAFTVYQEKGVDKKNPNLAFQLIKELAIIKGKLGEYDEAVGYLEKLEKHYRDKENNAELGSVFITLGQIYENKNDLKRAEYYFIQAIAVSVKIEDKNQRTDRLSAAYNNLGGVERQLGRYDPAIKNLRRAVSLLSQPKHEIDVCYCDLAEAYFSAGRCAESQAAYQDAHRYNPDNWNVLSGLARIAERNGNYSSADSLHRKAVEAAEKRAKHLEGLSIVSFFESVAPVYREAVRFFASRKQFQESLILSERSRARYMEYLSALAAGKMNKGDDPALTDSLKRMEQAITAGYARKKNASDFSAKDELALRSLEIEKDRFIKNLQKNYPDYYHTRYSAESDISAIRKSLGTSYQILIYTLTHDSLVGLVMTGDTVTGKVLPVSADELRRRVEVCLETDDGSLEEHYRLYRDLFEPFRGYLSDEKELIIVPDGVLYYLPFEMLVKEPWEMKNRKEAPYLVYDYAISYAPSATAFSNRIDKKAEAAYNYAGFAASDFKKLPSLNFVKGQTDKAYNIFSLRNVFAEPLEIKDQIFREAGDYKILDFATHAEVNDFEPLYSRIIFFDDTTLTHDSLLNNRSALYGYEVYNLDLSADLVVLGGCRTALGRYAEGEGLIGFQHAFSYAGAGSLLMSLWPVEDYSTSEIIASFYTYLNQGCSKTKALQKAKKDFLSRSHELRAHPQFWAGLTLWGNPETIDFRSDYRPAVITGIAVLGLVLAGIVIRKKKYFSQKS